MQATGQTLPEFEKRFCEIILTASLRYDGLRQEAKRAEEDKNGILQKRAHDAMTSTARDRNSEILKLVQNSKYLIESWDVQLKGVKNPSGDEVTFVARPVCSKTITIHFSAPANGPFVESLATRRGGDILTGQWYIPDLARRSPGKVRQARSRSI